MEENFLNNVIELYKNGQWQEITERYHDYPERNKLLWVFPSEGNFRFLQTCLADLNCDEIISVGCGSGLLEWMIVQATGIPVKGIEIDGAWWRCRYAPPTFIPLSFTPADIDEDTITSLQENTHSALLFCYFNNRPAFEEYLRHFSGQVLVIIGPGDGKGVHTDPRPFGDVSSDWRLYNFQEVRNSRDFITVYCRY